MTDKIKQALIIVSNGISLLFKALFVVFTVISIILIDVSLTKDK